MEKNLPEWMSWEDVEEMGGMVLLQDALQGGWPKLTHREIGV